METLADSMKIKNVEIDNYYDISNLLKNGKKIVTFMGASKSGTSFMLNNVAQLLSSKGIDVAILDTTKNRNSYYIYTKNQESLRKIACSCMDELAHGVCNGIKVNNNLTVYTAVPGEEKTIKEVEPILETLLKKHSLIIIDCDFNTPIEYFEYATKIYLVQTMEVLTIQPLTEVLLKMKNKGILEETKLRIIINKYVELNGITEKEIIGGMAFYNEPSMSYMKQLFNKYSVQFIKVPFDKQVYENYLEAVANCDISLEGYPDGFIQILEQLCNEINSIES